MGKVKSLVVATVIVVVVVVVAIVAVAAVVTPTMDAVPIDVVAKSARTGDLLLFQSAENIVRLYTPFTHIGMVVYHGGRTYVVETHQQGDVLPTDAGGVHMYDLAERVSRYDGRVCYTRLKRPLTDGQGLAIHGLVYRYRDVPFYSSYIRHYVTHCILGVDREKTDRSIFCSEFIGLLFKHIGMYDGETQCLVPMDVIKFGHHERLVRIKKN